MCSAENILRRKKAEKMTEIDFVVTWVDGSDPEWQRERLSYKDPEVIRSEQEGNTDDGANRYRDWGLLKYWFRAVEKNAPWVRKVHFITWGHLPDFLNKNAPRLNIVRHGDYIPKEYMPTYSSHPIELHMHRIKGLTEQFVYFNDDMFLNSIVKPTDFFRKDKPCYEAVEACIAADDINEIYPHIMLNNMCVINHRFNKRSVIKKHPFRWFNPVYGAGMIRNICLAPWGYFQNIMNRHLPVPLLRSTMERVWEQEYETLHKTSLNKFRSITDINQYLFRYFDIMEGNFVPKKQNGLAYHITSTDTSALEKDIIKGKHSMICVNDTASLEDVDTAEKNVQRAFEMRYPEKSSFEI